MSEKPPVLVLASSSPRRRELLCRAGYRFEAMPPPTEQERVVRGAPSPGAYVEALAYLKAAAVIDAHGLTEGLVLGADTAVELEGELLGKPDDEADARRILGRLAGTEHRVLTGLALVDVAASERRMAHDATIVRMRPMSDAEIGAYVHGGEALGKAGAYAIQETGDRYVERIEGSFSNVVGLPTELLERMLTAAGYDPEDLRDRV